MTMPNIWPAPVHVFADSGSKDHRDIPICTCGALKDARMHDLPDRPVDDISHRIVGEGSDE